MSFGVELQDPSETSLYELDWNTWAGASSIVSSVWTIWPTQFSPAAPTIAPIAPLAGITGVEVTGVLFGKVYQLTNTVHAADGSVIGARSITIRGGQK